MVCTCPHLTAVSFVLIVREYEQYDTSLFDLISSFSTLRVVLPVVVVAACFELSQGVWASGRHAPQSSQAGDARTGRRAVQRPACSWELRTAQHCCSGRAQSCTHWCQSARRPDLCWAARLLGPGQLKQIHCHCPLHIYTGRCSGLLLNVLDLPFTFAVRSGRLGRKRSVVFLEEDRATRDGTVSVIVANS
jgi:hypothetical protein